MPCPFFQMNSMSRNGWIRLKFWFSNVIPAVAVPGFFMISAIFLYSKPFTWTENFKKKCRRILLPYLLINAFWVLFFKAASLIPAIAPYFASEQYRIDTLADVVQAFFAQTPLYYPFWFLKDLFLLNLLASILRILAEKCPVLLMTASAAVYFCKIPIPLLKDSGCIFFWVIGLMLVKYGFDLTKTDRMRTLEMKAAWCLTAVLYYIFYNNTAVRLCYILTAFFCILHLCGRFSLALSAKWIGIGVRQTFIIYAFHEFYEAMLKKVIMSALPQTGAIQLLEYLLLPLFIIIVCIAAGELIFHVAPGFFVFLNGGRKRA